MQQWDNELIEKIKDFLRKSDTLEKACNKASDYTKESIRPQTIIKEFRNQGLLHPDTYLRGGTLAAARGDHPGHNNVSKSIVAPGFVLKGISTLMDGEGNVKQQWTKTQIDLEYNYNAFKKAILSLAKPMCGKSTIPPMAEGKFNENLLAVYPWGDVHMGLYTWKDETGENFDLKIAERDLIGAVDYLVDQAPKTREALIVNLGDFFHSDNMDNKTRRSGNILDVDGRFPKILAVGIRAIRRCIDRALEKHETVKIINAIGNHDDHTSLMLSLTLSEFYSNNPRVIVETAPTTYHYHRFGKVLIGVTHGHETKPEKLQGVMATDRAEDWGATSFRHWLTGHVHHDQRKDFSGCTFESFRTLAAKDAYATSKGYRSDRDMKCIVYHKEYGEVYRYTSNIKLIRALQNRK
jgi:hypothetical protein